MTEERDRPLLVVHHGGPPTEEEVAALVTVIAAGSAAPPPQRPLRQPLPAWVASGLVKGTRTRA